MYIYIIKQTIMKQFIQIIDNRNGKADLEIQEFGIGKWWVFNEFTDKVIPVASKQDAIFIRNNHEQFDI